MVEHDANAAQRMKMLIESAKFGISCVEDCLDHHSKRSKDLGSSEEEDEEFCSRGSLYTSLRTKK